MSEEKATHQSKVGPLGPAQFENDLQDIDPKALAASHSEAFLKGLEELVDEAKALVEKERAKEKAEADALKRIDAKLNREWPR